MFKYKTARCPVGDEKLGYIVKGEMSSFTCEDCHWVFTWDTTGALLAPVKAVEKRIPKRCNCVQCKPDEE